MIPTLIGRRQTRLAMLGTVGAAWTSLVMPALPRGGASLDHAYRVAFLSLLITAMAGTLVWDPMYHGLRQLRWEKDWPSLFALVTVANEALATWIVLRLIGASMPASTFAVLFATTWLMIWLVIVGPIRGAFLRRRFRGGRVLGV